MWVSMSLVGLMVSASWADDLRRTPIVEAVEKATPSVVTIGVEVASQNPFMFRRATTASEGSGVILNPDGVVLTNAHVVDGAVRVTGHLQDERALDARVVALDNDLDLAVLKVDSGVPLPSIEVGDSRALYLGEPAIAIGNPFGLGLTVSTGVVASVARDVNVGSGPVQTYIQTDAAINPGNSGGALVDVHGRLIGINTFIHSAAEGIGFAIPVHRALKIADDLLAYGRVQVPWLGVALEERWVGRQPRLVVTEVLRDGPAARAGVRAGDVIREVAGHRVQSRADVNARLAELRVGSAVRMTTVRDGEDRAATLTTSAVPDGLGTTWRKAYLGLRLETGRGGLTVVGGERGRGWFGRPLEAGDVIVAVDGERILRVSDLDDALTAALGRHRATVYLMVQRGPYRGTVELDLR
ncbi:MAG: trypsin-like peptidase domain-containing protein [Myxococcota bacterium]